MALDTEKIIADLKEASILELNDLVKAIEEEFGVSAAAPVAAAGAAAGAAEEKSEFDVELTDPGAGKVKVIKAVKDITGLGLKDAKGLVDGAPSVIKEGVAKEEAEEIQAKLIYFQFAKRRISRLRDASFFRFKYLLCTILIDSS